MRQRQPFGQGVEQPTELESAHQVLELGEGSTRCDGAADPAVGVPAGRAVSVVVLRVAFLLVGPVMTDAGC